MILLSTFNELIITFYRNTFSKHEIQCKTVMYSEKRLSPSENSHLICLIESPLKMIKNVFYFILKALFVLKIF